MSKTIFGLVLGGTLVLFATACGQGSPTESIPSEVENIEVSDSDTGNEAAQNPEAEGKPLVTVSRSPT